MKSSSLIESIRFRLFWLKYGVIFGRSTSFSIKKLTITGKKIGLSIPTGEEKMMNWEIQKIFYDDCYGLRKVEGDVKSVLDVGSNLGFFSVAARSYFPNAVINSYEPNPQILKNLLSNTSNLSIQVYPEAIGVHDGKINMNADQGSLFGKTIDSLDGNISKIAIAKAIERIGGTVDLLKLDCEGAEWELFGYEPIWKKINRLTMEYHLWANPKVDIPDMVEIIRGLGFRITLLEESPKLKWGMLQAVKT